MQVEIQWENFHESLNSFPFSWSEEKDHKIKMKKLISLTILALVATSVIAGENVGHKKAKSKENVISLDA